MTRTHALFLAVAAALGTATAQLPEPATGGKGGGPLDLLILRGHATMNFGQQPELDAAYQQKLKTAGYRVTIVSEWQPLTPDYLRQFNTVLYLNPGPYLSGSYFDATDWNAGWHLLTVQSNVPVLRRYVEAGGGLLIAPALEEAGVSYMESLRDLLAPWGLRTACANVRDLQHAYEAARVINVTPVYYSWTEALAKHPVTEGAKRIYYPAYCTRWDDNYTTLPLFPEDPAWVRLVQSMPGTPSMCIRGSIYNPATPWFAMKGLDNPAILAARDVGKGRLAVCGISPFILYYYTYAKEGQFAEANYSRVDGIAMEKGDGATPSDLHLVLNNLYRWLAQPSAAAGHGGGEAAGTKLAPADTSKGNEYYLSDRPAAEDPLMTGAPIRPMKILVGARSAIGGGEGTPADWARAAKAAGYDAVCFTEALESVALAQWPDYVAACRAASDAQVALLPGLDADTDLGNRFLIVGHTEPIREHLLTDDGKKLHWTGHMLLGMGDTLPIPARPARLATARENGALPPDLYKHIPGVAVATYRDGALVDDGRQAYEWNLFNASVPIPVAVHEVTRPTDLAKAAATGYQNLVPADTAAHAVFYFRQGLKTFGGNPPRNYLSSGPVIDSYAIDNWQAANWTVTLKAHGAQPLREVTVRDQYGLYRRFLPGTNATALAWHGDLGVQRWFLTEISDAAGGKALLPRLRTLPKNAVVRCGDRQNWFAPLEMGAVTYTGMLNCVTRSPLGIALPGVALKAPYCPKVQFPYSGEGLVVHEFRFDSTLVPGARPPESDNGPLFNDLPLAEFTGRQRFVSVKYGRSVIGRICEASVTTRQPLQASGALWPVLANTTPKPVCRYTDAAGKPVDATLTDATATLDLPAGAVVNNLLLLTPARVSGQGALGCPGGDREIPTGTRFALALMQIDAAKRDDLRRAYGFAGPTPYALELAQGKLERAAYILHLAAADHGIAGTIRDGKPGVGGLLPLRASSVSPRWPLGVWRPADGTSAPATLTAYACFEGAGLGLLDVTRNGPFYCGNLITATDASLNLAFVAPWTATGTRIEVNNPTDKTISATVASPKAITDRKAFSQSVEVPAGATIYVDVK